MSEPAIFALAAGILASWLAVRGDRRPVLGWLALAPLAATVGWLSPLEAGLAGLLAGAVTSARSVLSATMRRLLPITVIPSALLWGAGFALGAWVVPDGSPAWLALAVPVVAVAVHVPLRVIGAPRWVSNPLACTQEPWLPVVHIGRIGGDLAVTATLALGGSALALLALGDTLERIVAALAASAAAGAVGVGTFAYRAAVRRVDAAPKVRVAAVVADASGAEDDPNDGLVPIRSAAYADVPGTVRRYAPLVARAVGEGARILVLPEVAVRVEDGGDAWLAAVEAMARQHRVAIVAPFFDAAAPRNRLAVVDETGVVARYDKQHPARGLEPERVERTPVGPHHVRVGERTVPLSTVICVDLDYGDLVSPVRRSEGLLAAPSNDWFDGFEELHHRTAVWAAVLSGRSVVRATGHGISAVLDGAGRVLARASSRNEPVVLVVDAPLG